MNRLSLLGKISIPLVIGCIAMLWLFPMWRIDLRAPQYPGGLIMKIHINDISGDVEIISGLNHYIGMKEIHKEDFKEFVYMPVVFMVFMALGLIVLLRNRKSWYYAWTVLFLFIAAISFYDFWRWEYDYGHDLDPHAPIQVPGMSYQPPLIGYKKLLNFEALSQPDIGGWFYIAAGLILVCVTIYEYRKNKNKHETPV